MKKIIALFLIIVFVITLAACGSNIKKPGKTKEVDVENTESNYKDSELSEEDIDKALSMMSNSDQKKWPTDRVHPDMPKYKKGKFNGWNQWGGSEYDIFMLIDDTSEADLEEYKAELLASGFELVNGSDYRKDVFEIQLEFNTESILRISSYKEDVFSWPKDLTGIPPLKKGNLVGLIEPSDEIPNAVQLYYINLTQADIDEWAKELEAKGFEVENNYISLSNATFKGKTYDKLYVQLQENGTNEWMVDFFYTE